MHHSLQHVEAEKGAGEAEAICLPRLYPERSAANKRSVSVRFHLVVIIDLQILNGSRNAGIGGIHNHRGDGFTHDAPHAIGGSILCQKDSCIR